jgi:dTDP-4-dehydrorhamnose 3,5-epimerase
VRVAPLAIPDVLLIEPDVFVDHRGSFRESFNAARYREFGIEPTFVQDNVSFSRRGVLRGLHFQNPQAQGKLVSVMAGEVVDVAVDIRVGSPTFGQWVAARLSDANAHQLYVPAGFAHGFLVLSETAVFSYKCTEYYHRPSERSLRWNDPRLGIEWPITDVIMADRDREAPTLDAIPPEHLFRYEKTAAT